MSKGRDMERKGPGRPDFISLYRTRVHERLSEHDAMVTGEVAQRTAEVLLLPSFHPETMIHVSQHSSTTLRFATMSSSLWYYEQAARMEGSESTHAESPTPIEELCQIIQSAADSFWTAIEAIQPDNIDSTNTVGIDGISIRASCQRGSHDMSFEAWGPRPESPQGQFVRLLVDLAWDVLRSKQAVERLEQLHGYLQSDLPTRWIEGHIPCLRLFGRLSSNDEGNLQSLFGTLPCDESLVIDMTNFEGMGTLLYPVFVGCASRHKKLAWAASPAAMAHFKAMGISEASIFSTVEDARRFLVRHGANRSE